MTKQELIALCGNFVPGGGNFRTILCACEEVCKYENKFLNSWLGISEQTLHKWRTLQEAPSHAVQYNIISRILTRLK